MFGGYSYSRASVNDTGTILCPGPACPTKTFTDHPSLNGWEASLVYKPAKDLGLVADFGGNYGSLPARSGGGSMHTNTYLFGPQVSFPSHISPFVHVLAGVAHESNAGGLGSGPGGGFFFQAHSGNAFAIALGGGVDVDVVHYLRVRLIQLDYVGSNSGASFRNQARIAAGVVLHL